MRMILMTAVCCVTFICTGCDDNASPPAGATAPTGKSLTGETVKPVPANAPVKTEQPPSTADSQENAAERQPPRPPITEDFQGPPQLSLFPRVGDFRPANDSDRLPYWNTFIEHLTKVTGVAEEQSSGERGWVFRGIDTIDSVGYFSPLAVEPDTTYRVSFTLNAELPEEATAGIGILEFDTFLWLSDQYTEETYREHFRGSQEGVRLSGTVKGPQSFSFTTGSQTGMIHLVLFREGTHDRNSIMFDNITIE